jgi:hypothetical protein
MSKTTPEAERAAGWWRGVAITALVMLAASLAAVLLWFFADPLHLPKDVLEVLEQRASVAGMFTGMGLGVAGLVVAVVALRAQARAERAQGATVAPSRGPSDAARNTRPQVSAPGERSVAIGGDNSGIVATGDGARNVQLRAEASGQGRVYQSGGDQHLHQGDDQRRTYGGDHLEFHHNTFPGTVIGKQVNLRDPAPPDGDSDGRR